MDDRGFVNRLIARPMDGKRLMEHWQKHSFEIFDYLKMGLPAYTTQGKRIVDLDTLERIKEHSYERILQLTKLDEGAKITQTVMIPGKMHRPRIPKRTEAEILQEAKRRYDAQPSDKPVIPEGCHAVSFTLPANDKKAAKAIEEAMSFKFKIEDIDSFATKHGLSCITQKAAIETLPDPPPEEHTEREEIDPDEFVRSLSFTIESDFEIGIQVDGKPKKTINREALGFGRPTRNQNVTWDAFYTILKSLDHLYRLKPSKKTLPDNDIKTTHNVRNNTYDRERSTLKRMNEILVTFLQKEFESITFPGEFKVYESVPGHKRTYRMKFKIFDSVRERQVDSEYEKMSADEIYAELGECANNGWSDKFQDILLQVSKNELTKEIITPEKLKRLYEILRDKEEMLQDTGAK